MTVAAEFAGCSVWVTGAGSGIGRAVALAFHAQGAQVWGLDRRFDGDPPPFETQLLDLTRPDDVERVLATQPRLDVLVHAAGVLRMGSSDTLSLEDWHTNLQVNTTAAFHLFRHVVPRFKQQRRGAIVTVGSNAAHVPRIGMAGYCASKAALVALTRCVALELAGHGVRCNVVSPGTTRTPMLTAMGLDDAGIRRTVAGLPEQYKLGIPLGKVAQVQDIADTVLFLASDRAGHVTMQDLVVDGGATLGA